MTYHIYYDYRGQVSMYAENPIEAPNFQHIELELTRDDLQKLTNGYQGYIQNNLLDLRKI